MREGMILEVHNNYLIVLTKTGEFLKLKKKGSVNVGDIYKGKIYKKIPYLYTAAAAILLVIFTSLASYTAYAHQIVGYVDITGSKSVRLYVNRMGNVQRVDGVYNSSGLKNIPIEKAVEKLDSGDSNDNIFDNANKVSVSTTDLKPSHVNFQSIKDKIQSIINSKGQGKQKPNSNNTNNTNDNTNSSNPNSGKTGANSGSHQKQPGRGSLRGKPQSTGGNTGTARFNGKSNPTAFEKILHKPLSKLDNKDKK